LEEIWKNKEKFYEDTKDFLMVEIVTKIEDRYKELGTAPLKNAGLQVSRHINGANRLTN